MNSNGRKTNINGGSSLVEQPQRDDDQMSDESNTQLIKNNQPVGANLAPNMPEQAQQQEDDDF